MSLKKLFTAAILTMCVAGTAFAAEPIKIGIYQPLTGQNAFAGQLEVDGVRLAHKLKPTVLGRNVELVVVDNKSDKVESANAVTRLTSKDKVVGIIGTYASSLAMAGGEVAEEAKVPCIATSATNPLVTEGKKYYFRACFIDPYQGAGAATYAFRDLGFKKAAILQDVVSDYGVGLARFFEQSFKKLGGEIVAKLNYQSGDQDFTAQLTDIISKNPDVLYIPAYFAEGAIIMKQVRELGGKFRIMGGDAMDNPDVVSIGGDAVEGFLITAFAYAATMPNMNPLAKEFTDAWYAEYPDKEPNMNSALAYTAYMMFMYAIEKSGSADPQAITDALAAMKDLPTIFGPMTMDENHNPLNPVIGLIEVKDGKRQYIGEVVPAI